MRRFLAFAAALALTAPQAVAAETFCIDCISIRFDVPKIVRGPFPDELDNAFTAIRLRIGTFRAFSANGSTYAIDGEDVFDVRGDRREVLAPGPKGSDSECGRWLNAVLPGDGFLYGLVHQESRCNYTAGETHKTVAIATSTDQGATWTDRGDIIRGPDAPKPHAITGEGDCTMTDAQDGFFYAYCLRNSDSRTIAARAPSAGPLPGQWRKYAGGRWDTQALGGTADSLGFLGVASAYFPDFGRVALAAVDPWFGGVRLSFSADKAHFTDLGEPLVPIDGADWNRPAPTDLIAYASFVDPLRGTNTLKADFLLAFVYVPAGKGFTDRYLVFQPAHLELNPAPVAPQVGITLGRYQGIIDRSSFRTATGPLFDDEARFALDRRLGYLMTRPPEGKPSLKLEECVDGKRYRLEVDGTCARAGARRLRTAGWIYESDQPGTVPLYACRRADGGDVVANNPECDDLGTVVSRLGYALRN